MESPPLSQVITFGCRLNTYESEVMGQHAKKAGLSDAVIFNTCAVTSSAKRQALQAIRQTKRQNPQARIIVTGCAAQLDPQTFHAMPEVDLVWGNAEKMNSVSFEKALVKKKEMLVGNIFSTPLPSFSKIPDFKGRTRAFLQIQNGCNHRCTFCTIPYARGQNRSVPVGFLVDQVKTFVEKNINEVVLTGVDLTAYGEDLPGTPRLGDMVKRLLNHVPGLKRLRLSSLDPAEIDDTLFELIGDEKRLLPHFHLSLQAGDDMILKRMRRRHLRHHILSFCARVSSLRPESVFGADIIAGFPTETPEMFQNTLSLITACPLTYAHVFPYSPRPGTPATRMPQVPPLVVRQRAKILREAGKKQMAHTFQAYQHCIVDVLVEKENFGRSQHFAPVYFKPVQPLGSVVKMEVIAAHQDHLVAQPVERV